MILVMAYATLIGVCAALSAAWVLSSSVLLTLITTGMLRVARERRRAAPVKMHGAPVLITDDLGPAVSGFAQPVVLVPRWVLALDESKRQLLLAHESEHLRARDGRLLWLGAFAVALLPWNPAVWWIARPGQGRFCRSCRTPSKSLPASSSVSIRRS